MNIHTLALLAIAGSATAIAAAEKESSKFTSLGWPTITQGHLPGTRWWWMGNAVNPTDLVRELRTFRQAGLGTVEITPIYGVKGYEDQSISYLGPQWLEILKSTVSEAQKLDMSVDMVTGTGWCFGGPNISDADANAVAVVKMFDVNAGTKLTELFDRDATQALVAFGPDGNSVDLTQKIGADGAVDWDFAGDDPWRVYAVSQKPSGVKVKRPAPGGEGWMLNLLYPDAMPRYLQKFSDALAKYDGPKPHAQFHDSYEYRSDWAPDFFEQFEKRRGYKLQSELPALFESKGDRDHVERVKCDYRETVSELIEESIRGWTQWSHEQGSVSRNQAHGSPGNWLDIYAASDIPETEMFYQDRDILVSKFASSAAHVTGKKLIGSETGTWVAEHFTETLADLKYLFDDMFLSGVNCIMYHGTAYSPADAPWPGWSFYASTQMNPRNSIWRDVPALNNYVARVQSVLQESKPDNDILLYWPIYDSWHHEEGMVKPLTIHARDWFGAQPIGKAARRLWERGNSFDYISDKQLQNAKPNDGVLDLFGNQYRIIVVPECEHMPLETLKKLHSLAEAGATVIFVNQLPQDVPGLGDLKKRRAEFGKLTWQNSPIVPSEQLEAALDKAGVPNEQSLVSHAGVHFVRRAVDGGGFYFISNRGTERLDQWIQLSKAAAQAAILDPISGRSGLAEVRNGNGGAQVYLQLEPGESLILRTFENQAINAARWNYWRPIGEPIEIKGTWDVKFIEGGPVLPKGFITPKLGSWTEVGGEQTQSFGGTARYTLRFAAPKMGGNATAQRWTLDLGKVCQSARVRLNGKELGTVFISPFRMPVDELKSKDNVLEVEVTSTSANRIRDLDRRGVKWKIFYDINIVNLNYKPFDASEWPVAKAGLMGPVTLQAEKMPQKS